MTRIVHKALNIWHTDIHWNYLQTSTKFVNDDDVKSNTKGERTSLFTQASNFRTNYAQQRYNPNPSVTGRALTSEELEISEDDTILHCAWRACLTGNVDDALLVRDELRVYLNLVGLNFSNETRFQSSLKDVKIWKFGIRMLRYFQAYRMLRTFYGLKLFTATDYVNLDRFFFWVADYFQRRNVDVNLGQYFVNRDNDNYNFSTTAGNQNSGAGILSPNGEFLWMDANGVLQHPILDLEEKWNNRREAETFIYYSIGLEYKHFGHSLTPANINWSNTSVTFTTQPQIESAIQKFIDSGYRYDFETLVYAVRPSGAQSDTSRWADNYNNGTNQPDKTEIQNAISYPSAYLNMMIQKGYSAKLCGEKSILDAKTRDGYGQTRSPNTDKTLKLIADFYIGVQRGERVIYGTKNANDLNLDVRIGFYEPSANGIGANRRWYMRTNWYLGLGMYQASKGDNDWVKRLQDTYLWNHTRVDGRVGYPPLAQQKGIGAWSADYQTQGHGWTVASLWEKGMIEFNKKVNPFYNTITK
jgi:hypothetical protein